MSDLDPHEVQEAMRLAIQAGFRITKFSKASGAGFAEEHEIVALIKLARQNAIPREIHERLIAEKDAALAELRGYNEREYAVARAAIAGLTAEIERLKAAPDTYLEAGLDYWQQRAEAAASKASASTSANGRRKFKPMVAGIG
jgi:hypothetical protein